MPLHSAISVIIFLSKEWFLSFSLGSFDPLMPHAIAVSNYFCNFHQNYCSFRHFHWGLWTLLCLKPLHSAIFFSNFHHFVFFRFRLGFWTLSCLMPLNSAIFFSVIFVKIVVFAVSIIFIGVFGSSQTKYAIALSNFV